MADDLSSSQDLVREIAEMNRLMREARNRVQGDRGSTSDFQLLRSLEAEDRIKKELELNSYRRDAFNRMPPGPAPTGRLYELRAQEENLRREAAELQRSVDNMKAQGEFVPFELAQRAQRAQDRITDNLNEQKEQQYQIANPDQSRNRERDRLQAEEDALNLRLQEAEAKRRDQALKLRIKEEESAARAVETIVRQNQLKLSEIEAARLTQIEQGLRSGLLTEDDAARQRLAARSATVREEIAAEEEKINRLSKLRFTEKESAIANNLEIAESRQEIVGLNLDLVRAVRAEELNLEREVIQAIADRGAAERAAHDLRISELSEYSNGVNLLTQSFARQIDLLGAESALLQARDDLTATGIDLELQGLERALQIRMQLNDETLDEGVRQVLTAEFASLTGDPAATEADIIGQQIAREQELQEVKRRSLAIDQQAAREKLALDNRRDEFAAQRLVIESESDRISALQAVDEARNRLEQLQADSSTRPEQLDVAESALASAQSRQRLSEANAAAAVQSLLGQGRLGGLESLALGEKQKRDIIEFEANDVRVQQAQDLRIAQAKARGVNVEDVGRLPSVDIQGLLDRNQRLLTDQLVPTAPGALIDESSSFKELLELNRKHLTATEGLSTSILRLLNRPAQVNNVRVLQGTPLDDVLQDEGL